MRVFYIENPDLNIAVEKVLEALRNKMLIMIAGSFSVDYSGRASSKLDEGDRIFIIKQDKAVLVHRPNGYKPVNWQPPGSRVNAVFRDGKMILEAIRLKPREKLIAIFTKIYFLFAIKLYDIGEFEMYLTEEDMKRVLIRHPDIIEEGLTIIKTEKELESGKADIIARDKNFKIVIIELKKHKIHKSDVLQLYRYVSKLRETNKNIRGIIVGTAVDNEAMIIADKLDLEIKTISLRKLSEYKGI